MSKTSWILTLAILLALAIGGFIGYVAQNKAQTYGGVPIANEYRSARVAFDALATTSPVASSIKTFGSVIITSSTPALTFYDWDGVSTTVSTTIAVMKGGISEGTFVFDRALINGLYYAIAVTNTGEFVVTYR